jgi:antitoxin HicB
VNYVYPAQFEPQEEEGGFVVTFPDWPEAITQGESLDDAYAQAEDALEEAVANRIVMKLGLPPAREVLPGMHAIAVPAPTAVKAALYAALQEDGRTQLELAALLAVDGREIRRLLDPYHPTKLTRIYELLRTLGRRLEVRVGSTAVEVQVQTSAPNSGQHRGRPAGRNPSVAVYANASGRKASRPGKLPRVIAS